MDTYLLWKMQDYALYMSIHSKCNPVTQLTFYKLLEPSFTPVHIQNLNMLKWNSTREAPKNERPKKILPKQSNMGHD